MHQRTQRLLINPTREEECKEEPLLAFSWYITCRKNHLLSLADEIEENLEAGFSEPVNLGGGVARAEILMWLWILGAYEVVRTMCQAKSCFSTSALVELQKLKKTLSVVRMPAAKMEKPGKKTIPVSSNRSPAGYDYANRDLWINDPDEEIISARSVLSEFSQVIHSITKDDVIKMHEQAYSSPEAFANGES